MKYIIIGLGNYGGVLAEELTALGHEVIGADSEERNADRLKDKIATSFVIDATDEDALSVLPLRKVDVVIVAIGENFGASVRVVSLLKKNKVPHIYARALDDVTMFCKQLVLSLAADGHDLAEKLLHAKAVKVSVSFFFQGMDLLALTCRVQYLFACFYFVFSDFLTHLHSFFKETYDLAVNLIDLVSVSFQIRHWFPPLCFLIISVRFPRNAREPKAMITSSFPAR